MEKSAEKRSSAGRPKTGQAPPITIRLGDAERARMEAVRQANETPSQFIRAAIEREIAARQRG